MRRLPTTLVGSLVLALLLATTAACASWPSFDQASFDGMSLSPSLGSGDTSCVLALSESPGILLNGTRHDVSWVQAFYIVGDTESTRFTATAGPTGSDWTWDTKLKPGQIAGWKGEGNNRLYPGQVKAFQMQSLQLNGAVVVPGFHLGYQSNGQTVTGFWRGDVPLRDQGDVPEPSVGLLAGLIGLVGPRLVSRRRARA